MFRVVRRASSIALATALAVAATLAVPSMASASGTSTISGMVFQDLNRNGVQDAGEAGFANQGLFLFDSTGTNIAGAVTDANGHYSFGGLADGSYQVAFDTPSWLALRNAWVPTTTGTLYPRLSVALAGSAAANFGLRPIVRSATLSTPITSFTGPNGLLSESYDDVVTAQQIYKDLMGGSLVGPEAADATIRFDYGNAPTITYTTIGVNYLNAQTYLGYVSWLDQGDACLFHEYGHVWSIYNANLVHNDPTLTTYLKARGVYGNPLIGSDMYWDPQEMIAEDYREFFGTPSAAAYPQANTAIPRASQVSGLKTFLQSTFTQPPYRQPLPSVTGVGPAVGPAGGGTSVTITGSNFTGSGWAVSGVAFGGVPAPSYSVSSPNQILAVAPAGSGVADVTVRTTAASGGYVETSGTSSADQYAYAPMPTVSGLSPAKGSIKGGTFVTITGSGFGGPGFSATSVTFGVPATFTVTSPTTLVATSPVSKILQSVAVTVTTPGGTSSAEAASTFTYTRK